MITAANSTPANLHSNADSTVGIVVALPEELRTLTNIKLKQGECIQLGKLLIAYGGAGMANAREAAQSLLHKGAKQLVSWGCAAGLAKDLKPGDLLLADKVVSEQNQFDTDTFWCNHVRQTLQSVVSVHNGRLFTSKDLISSSLRKYQIQQDRQTIALDMESAAIAEVAKENGMPFLVIRSIADPVTMDLPAAVLAGLNDQGQVELPKLLLHLISHPWEIVGLIRLGLHFHAAQKTLKLVAKHLGIQDDQLSLVAN